MKYANGTPFTYVYDKFEHYLEDMDDCSLCVNFASRKVGRTHGGCCCGRSVCEFQDLKDEAIRNNRLKIPKG
jgi:predicted DNA-binding protein